MTFDKFDDQGIRLVARGRQAETNGKKDSRRLLKFRSKNFTCYYWKNRCHMEKDCLKWKNKDSVVDNQKNKSIIEMRARPAKLVLLKWNMTSC